MIGTGEDERVEVRRNSERKESGTARQRHVRDELELADREVKEMVNGEGEHQVLTGLPSCEASWLL